MEHNRLKPSDYSYTCPEILLESVATHTYCIFLTVYSIGGIKITKSLPAIFDAFFQVVDSPIRNASRKGAGGWGAGAEQPTQIKSRKRHFELAR